MTDLIQEAFGETQAQARSRAEESLRGKSQPPEGMELGEIKTLFSDHGDRYLAVSVASYVPISD
jgi:hypothetical protein